MKTRMKTFVLLCALVSLPAIPLPAHFHAMTSAEAAEKEGYHCPMHPNFKSDKPGSCPICGMNLVKDTPQQKTPVAGKPTAQGEAQGRSRGRIKFYRNPMNPEQTSPTPRKDEMGMDYIPVYEESPGAGPSVNISPERQQMIGVTTEKVQLRALRSSMTAVGRVAYDPGLFVAQQEYLQAIKTADKLADSSLPVVKEQASSLVSASRQKLLLLGMNQQEIKELTEQGKPQESLYLPGSGNTAWVYISVYEYEVPAVTPSVPVEVTANAYPGEVFKGKISSIAPVFNKETRTLQVRAVVEDDQHKLKPEMFVNAVITRDLGEKLAVPESAILDTGVRKVVYVRKEDDTFEQRQIKTGLQAEGYYEVLEGVNDGEEVVTNGNFLIDSETRLKSG